ncbi:hypothetical protein BGY98DRAFT_982330, partial [Russula aff. rugulosa BPL654]
PLSSPSVSSLTALLPPPPRKPTCSTSSASRPFRLNRFPNPLWSSMLPRPPTPQFPIATNYHTCRKVILH